MIPRRNLNLLAAVVIVVVAAVLVSALLIVGSPLQARRANADDRRVQDLNAITQMVRGYYSDHKKLPASLADCKPPSYQWHDVLTDPMTGKPYEYRVVDKTHFELAAFFETDGRKSKRWTYGDETFGKHPEGRATFTLPANSSGIAPGA